MRELPKPVTAVIGEYHDYFSYDMNLQTGKEVMELDGTEVNPDEYRGHLNLMFPKWIREELDVKW